jgi:hypothetical protein
LSFTTPENTARSPISVSTKNAGRCVIWSARNSVVDARTRFSISPDRALEQFFYPLAARSSATSQSLTFF